MRSGILLLTAVLMGGCATAGGLPGAGARAPMLAAIAQEVPGDYFIGRRYYKKDYKFWGYVRQPRQSWADAKLVMLNENRKLAPDREAWDFGFDNGYEYRMEGRFSGDTVYEPASNGFYPEFVLTNMQLVNKTPGPIFKTAEALNPERRIIAEPY